MDTHPLVEVPGTEHALPRDAAHVGPTPETEQLEVTVMVRPGQPLDELAARLNQPAGREAPIMSREAFAAAYGADPAALEAVSAFARAHGLQVVEVDAPGRRVRLAGSAATIGAAFGVDLQQYRLPDGAIFRAHSGPVRVPRELSDAVQSVFGLDARPQARRH